EGKRGRAERRVGGVTPTSEAGDLIVCPAWPSCSHQFIPARPGGRLPTDRPAASLRKCKKRPTLAGPTTESHPRSDSGSWSPRNSACSSHGGDAGHDAPASGGSASFAGRG